MGDGKKILLIDDDVNLVAALKMAFESEGFTVHNAYNGEDGIMLAREVRPDAIVLDVMMDGKHGFNVCKELKSGADTRDIGILIFSGMAGAGDPKYPRSVGLTTEADDYLSKPATLRAVLEKVKELIARG